VPVQGSLDCAWVNGNTEAGADAFGQSGRPHGRIGVLFLTHEGHDSIVHFVSPARASLDRKQAWQAVPFEGGLRFVDRRPRKSEILCGAANGLMVDTHAPQHLVFDLDQIARVEESILLKEFVPNLLGVVMKDSEAVQGFAFVVGR
jgi:hypothetical protein